MEILRSLRKFAFIVDNVDQTTINKNIGLFAQFLSENKFDIDVITGKLLKNDSIQFPYTSISLIRLPSKKEWPHLDHKNFHTYIKNNIHKYFCIWVYRGRPYAKRVVELAKKNNVTTVIKLDSDDSISLFGKYFLKLCSLLGKSPRDVYEKFYFLVKLLSFLPSIRGFYLYDSVLFQASLVLCESTHTENKLKGLIHGIDTFYLPNTIPIAKFTVYQNEFKRKQKKQNIIVSVGRIVPSKKFENGIKAFSLLPEKIKKDWKYEIIGPFEDKKYAQALQRMITKLKLDKNIKIIPGLYGKKLYSVYYSSSVLLMPYSITEKGETAEGQPNVIAEAMFFSNAIVTTSIPGTRTLLGTNDNSGILLQNASPNEIAMHLNILLSNRKKLELLQKNAKERIKRRFNLDKIAERLLKKIILYDYDTYISDQKSDSLALVPSVIQIAIGRYLDFFTKKYQNKIDFSKATILDIGCREFFTYDYFQKKYNNEISGIEIGNDALDYAKRKHIMKVDVHQMDNKLKNEHYDVIFAFHVFEHMYDLHRALRNCHKLLKKNGVLFFAIPMPAIDTRRSHWLDMKKQEGMVKILQEEKFVPIFYNTYPADVFRNEPEMLGIFKKN